MPRTWPPDWEDRRSGARCDGCEQGRPDEDEHGVRFFAGVFADAYLQRVAPVDGYSTVMFRGRHVADPVDLTPEETVGFWSDVRVAAQAIDAVFRPCHLNYQLLGNAVPHVHVHVLPRQLDDPAPERPLGDAVWARAARLPPDTLQSQVAALKSAAGHLSEDQGPCRPGPTSVHRGVVRRGADEHRLPVIDAWTRLEHVPPDECWALLAAAGVGRIGVLVEGAPEVYPLNFVVDGRSVVFRTDSGSKLLGLRRSPRVCLEIDGFDVEEHTGWSVLLKGSAGEVTDAAELRELAGLPLRFWTAGAKAHWMRIQPTEVTGRRLHASSASEVGET